MSTTVADFSAYRQREIGDVAEYLSKEIIQFLCVGILLLVLSLLPLNLVNSVLEMVI